MRRVRRVRADLVVLDHVDARALLVAHEALVRLDDRALARAGRLSFEDREPSTVTALDLEA